MIWFAALTIGAEALLLFGKRPPAHASPIVLRVLMHSGWYGFVQVARSYHPFRAEPW